MPAWGEWGDQQPQRRMAPPASAPQPAAGPPPPPMSMAFGQQPSTQPVGQTQPAPAPQTPGAPQQAPGSNSAAVNNFNQAYQNFYGNSDWRDTDRSPAQWEAWRQQEAQLRSRGGGAQNCPPDKPFTGRGGQCAFKPDDCPDGTHVEGSDTNGSAHCVPNGQGQEAPGFFGGAGGGGGFQQQQAVPYKNPNNLLSDTFAPQFGYFGGLGSTGQPQQGGQMAALGPLIQSLLGMQLG